VYETYFTLKCRPFSITSDPSFIFFSRRHQEAFDQLIYGISHRVGFMEITGEIGCGKTTLCRALLNHLDERTKTAYIFNSSLTGMQLMQTILHDLGMDPARKSRYELYNLLYHYLIDQLAQQHTVVLIVDEAQNLSVSLLEQIRMLSNLETDKEKLLQIVLVGQPQLRDKLKRPSLRQLRQRIVIRYHLSELMKEELMPYIKHRLVQAGAGPTTPFFEDNTVEAIYEFSSGVPRLINVICDKAMLLAFVRETQKINESMIRECVEEVEGIERQCVS
jgi:general secretion pathway protein A